MVPSFQCSLGGNWTLGIDDNFASIPKNAAEGLTEKGSVPVSVPLEARRSTNRIEKELRTERRDAQWPTPRMGRDKSRGDLIPFQVGHEFLGVGLHPRSPGGP